MSFCHHINFSIVSSIHRFSLASLIMLLGSCRKPEPAPAPEVKRYMEHEVRYIGETIGSISAWYTGSSAHYKEILKVNPGLNPNKIRRGDIVQLPAELVIRKEPISEEFVKRNMGGSTRMKVAPQRQSKALPSATPIIPAATPTVTPPPTSAEGSLTLVPLTELSGSAETVVVPSSVESPTPVLSSSAATVPEASPKTQPSSATTFEASSLAPIATGTPAPKKRRLLEEILGRDQAAAP